MSRTLLPSFLVTALLTGCALSPVTQRTPQPAESPSQAAIEQAIHKEVTYLLGGGQAILETASQALSLAPKTISAGDTVLSLLREAGAPESLFYTLPQRDRDRLSQLSPGDQLGLLSDGQASFVGIAVEQGGHWQMARKDRGTYRLAEGLSLSASSMSVVDLPLQATLAGTLAQSEFHPDDQEALVSLLSRGFPAKGLPQGGWLRLRMEQSSVEGVDIGTPELVSAALSVSQEPSFMVRYQLANGGLAYYNGNGERLEPDWIAHPIRGQYRITSEFNPSRRHPVTGRVRPHNGRDFAAKPGTPVVAATDGTVVHAGWKGSWGRLVVIRHANGIETRYAHLRSINGISQGDHVSRGQVIAGVGTSGLSTGPHLHFEVYQRGIAQNPASFDPGTSRAIASSEMTLEDRQWFERYRVLEGASLAQLPHKEYPEGVNVAWLTGLGGPDEEIDD